MNAFFQEGPSLKNQYEADLLLRHYLRFRLPADIVSEIEPGLLSFGDRVVGDVLAMANEAEGQPPRHVPFDPWGQRIDVIEVSHGWDKLNRVSAEEGLIALGYERSQGAYSRLHQLAKLYLFHPSSALFSCPLAMTDGAARAIELYGDEEMKANAFKNLTSRNPQRFWTSGQWMTERTGGSDVSDTSTVARSVDGEWRLFGDKWFTSATTSQMTMTLARIEGEAPGSKGLSLFYVELRDKDGRLRNIEINRLKDKLGTKALPTAELRLNGTPARLVGGQSAGVRKIASILNITRLYNSVCATAHFNRALVLAKDYARKRRAFGRSLSEQPLHLQTLSQLQIDFEGCFHLTFHMAYLLGKEECGEASAEETAISRLLTPIVKLWTAKQAVAGVSEVLEAFGGAGYVEDTGLPRLLRDAQVFPIWEGTTNVLSLDVLRAIAKDQAVGPFLKNVEARLSALATDSLKGDAERVRAAMAKVGGFLKKADPKDVDFSQAAARQLAFSLGQIYIASLMLEFADWCIARKQRPSAEEVAHRFCARDLAPLIQPDEAYRSATGRIVWGV